MEYLVCPCKRIINYTYSILYTKRVVVHLDYACQIYYLWCILASLKCIEKIFSANIGIFFMCPCMRTITATYLIYNGEDAILNLSNLCQCRGNPNYN